MLQAKLSRESKSAAEGAIVAVESLMSKSKSLATKKVSAQDKQKRNLLAIDGASEQHLLTSYSFLNKSTKPQIIGMDEVLEFENAENPKEAI